MDDDHDPWNDPAHRHPRAVKVMDESLWDCVNEHAPFGSDERADAYAEWRDWRASHPTENLTACLTWIGTESEYADVFTYDATIIATVLGQLVDEGESIRAPSQLLAPRSRGRSRRQPTMSGDRCSRRLCPRSMLGKLR